MERANLIAIGIACLFGANVAMAGNDAATTSTSTTKSSTSSTVVQDKAQFSAWDTNHDNYISESEAETAWKRDYNAADANMDGRLDASEFAVAMHPKMAQSSTTTSSTTQRKSESSSDSMGPSAQSSSSRMQ